MVQAVKPVTKGQMFWNAYGNLQAGIESETGYDHNRELLTYIQADPRYISYIEDYISNATDLAETPEDTREIAQMVHQESADILENSPGYSTDMQGLANDFYFVIEQNYDNAPPAPVTADAEIDALAELEDTQPEETPAYDPEFTQDQLGALALPPETTVVPVTTPIAAADMPIPIIQEEIEPEEISVGVEETVLVAAPAPITDTVPTADEANSSSDYTVEAGNTLWGIARDFYGIDPKDHASIQKAVNTVAFANGMGEGTNANDIDIGQVLKLPDNPFEEKKSLDWVALDKRSGFSITENFSMAVNNETPAAPANTGSAPRPVARPDAFTPAA